MSCFSRYMLVSALIFILFMVSGCTTGLMNIAGSRTSTKSIFDFVLKGTDGSPVEFSRYKGKVLMVDLFTTWSQPSIVAIAAYGGLYRKYKKDGLSVVGIALDELGDEVVQPFVEGMQIPYSVVFATKDIQMGKSLLGQIKAIPTLLLFDRSGRLKWVLLGLVKISELEKIIEDLL